ncbi:hypothetical protein I5907_12440 [Panacibacter sp. DH6]|uniref:Uncharacterized protein n=1 Tax=Panacibacter microcysteis TaxID=2793269 RepID=A0A931E850_9BACT|nr:hypothetical protein [Panacibacter microcysteis]MBG9377045.1 hypothetical protein [Panacibacter microcysteis]
MKNFCLGLLTLIVLSLNIRCSSNTSRRKNIANQDTSMLKPSILIGYDSLPIFLGSQKSEVGRIINLKWDKDNDADVSEVGYYAPSQVIHFEKLKGDLDLYFKFSKKDSVLTYFSASVVFDNYYRDKIIPNLKKELVRKFDKIIDFFPEAISSKDGVVKKYKDYEINVKMDSSSYSPTFYYSIELLR